MQIVSSKSETKNEDGVANQINRERQIDSSLQTLRIVNCPNPVTVIDLSLAGVTTMSIPPKE